VLALAVLLGVSAGCQTWNPITGQTLYSGYYLEHPPQYIPPSPPFPLPNELANLERATAAQAAGEVPPVPGAMGLPPAVAPAPAPAPGAFPPGP
jgi:hypothetical protein